MDLVGMISAVLFDLPALDGSLEVGIAVGVDPRLLDNCKLPVLENLTLSRAAGYAAVWAHTTSQQHTAERRALYTSAAAGTVLAGLCDLVRGEPDSDWLKRATIDPKITEKAPDETVQKDPIIKALSLVIATKAYVPPEPPYRARTTTRVCQKDGSRSVPLMER
ncbi:unnamed protein product [Bemisia tabaci]|uniref:Uncharacterized protein n=1 Tax=Bemisia tabaci TaxID=7038 RepID=A0A9P0AG20_BEMTA|nr:unnamed protein product [Bemisia tabaci]